MRKFTTKLIAVIAVIVLMTCTFAMPVSAARVGRSITGGSGTINSSGSFYVYLSRGNSVGFIRAGTAATGVKGRVTCYVTTPAGNTTSLGTISANGYHTKYRSFTYLYPGTYKFTFYANTRETIHVYARLYD